MTTSALFDLAPPSLSILVFGAATMLVLAKSVQPGNILAWTFTRRPLIALGRISYSFYLVHWMIVVLVARAVSTQATAWGPAWGSIAIFAGGFAGSAIVAKITWLIAERPYFMWVSKSGVTAART